MTNPQLLTIIGAIVSAFVAAVTAVWVRWQKERDADRLERANERTAERQERQKSTDTLIENYKVSVAGAAAQTKEVVGAMTAGAAANHEIASALASKRETLLRLVESSDQKNQLLVKLSDEISDLEDDISETIKIIEALRADIQQIKTMMMADRGSKP